MHLTFGISSMSYRDGRRVKNYVDQYSEYLVGAAHSRDTWVGALHVVTLSGRTSEYITMFGTKDANAEKAKLQQQGCKRVREWLEGMLPEDEKDEDDGGKAPPGKETSIIVNQLACKEVGCPDVEVTMQWLDRRPALSLRLCWSHALDLFVDAGGPDATTSEAATKAHVQDLQSSNRLVPRRSSSRPPDGPCRGGTGSD